MPEGGTLMRSHLKGFVDKLRNGSLGHFRYFAVGEYGDKTLRPHYHLAIFNTPPEHWAEYFDKKWEYGFTMAGEMTAQSAAYVSGYCAKKMTDKSDDRLDGARRNSQECPGHHHLVR
eukprot:TRINITY_DN8386_c0_g1_i1.p1 TRINITY_DN8386_c0_g1~~TRINITY_DN8386_c0_g1_i1.p1  ORF type:complete len:127 (+),score=9.80 TRINITY_DN8386_c0_g1_i1:32-382(+)